MAPTQTPELRRVADRKGNPAVLVTFLENYPDNCSRLSKDSRRGSEQHQDTKSKRDAEYRQGKRRLGQAGQIVQANAGEEEQGRFGSE
jgi:hypothetical protein